MNARIDVSQLARRREDDVLALPVRRQWMSRYLLPAMLTLAFFGVVGWAARDALVPAREVTVMPVLARRTAVEQAGQPLFSAAGWVEPRPTPVSVTALAGGVVRDLLVVEDQAVAAGEPVALLIDEDARLALRRAEAELSVREAELQSARASLAAAQTRMEQPSHLQSALAEAESRLAAAAAVLAAQPHQVRAAEFGLELAEQTLHRKSEAGGAVAAKDLDAARVRRDTARADLDALKSSKSHLEAEREALARKSSALRTELDLRTEETRQVAESEALLKVAEARAEQARVAVEESRLRLERMTVRAPVAGRILQVVAPRGSSVVAGGDTAGHAGGTVATLYDPALLQVRADVRLEDMRHVAANQRVRIETAAAESPLEGNVLYATSEADIQKNTLEVKIAVNRAPPVLKPQMLVQVTFLAPERSEASDKRNERLRVYVPSELVERDDDGGYLWVADLSGGVARRTRVTVEGTGELVEVTEGLNVSSRLIVGGRQELTDRQRIRVVAEDATLGLNP